MGFALLSVASVFKSIGGILLAIFILLAMITVHEFGHYLAGKLLGFKINEFSIGFGPAIFKRRSKKSGELFALRVIPLGGFCAFDGEDGLDEETEKSEEAEEKEEEPFDELSQKDGGRDESCGNAPEIIKEKYQKDDYPEPKGKRFTEQPPWKRIIVLVAGAFMNYLLALVLLIIMVGIYGQPMCIVMPIGYESGMEVQHAVWEEPTLSYRDILLEINGKEIAMGTDCIDALKGKKAGEEVPVSVLRKKDDEWLEKEVTLVLKADANFKNMADKELLDTAMGLEVFTTTLQRGALQTIGGALKYSGEMGTAVIRSLGEVLTGAMGLDSMGGPITTITQTAQAASMSPFSFLYMASFIGVNLAVFNLLPIPALDGCKVVFCIIEWIRKKPVSRKVEAVIHFVGIVFIFGFAILVDLLQLF